MKRRIRNIDTCLCLFPQGAFLLSSRLDYAVKCCSIEVLKLSFQPELLGKGSGPKRIDPAAGSEVVGVAKVVNN